MTEDLYLSPGSQANTETVSVTGRGEINFSSMLGCFFERQWYNAAKIIIGNPKEVQR